MTRAIVKVTLCEGLGYRSTFQGVDEFSVYYSPIIKHIVLNTPCPQLVSGSVWGGPGPSQRGGRLSMYRYRGPGVLLGVRRSLLVRNGGPGVLDCRRKSTDYKGTSCLLYDSG